MKERTMSAQVESIFAVRRPTWHRLEGTPLAQSPETAIECIQAAGIDWTVEKEPMFISRGEENGFERVPDAYAIIRSSDKQILGTTGSQYTPVQNHELSDWVYDNFVKPGHGEVDVCGSLQGGRKVFWTIRMLGLDADITPGDRQEGYLYLVAGHDGSHGVHVLPTSVRVVCMNTHRLAIDKAGKSVVRLMHKSGVHAALDDVAKFIDVTRNNFRLTMEQYRQFAARKISGQKELDALFAHVVNKPLLTDKGRTPPTIDDLRRIHQEQPMVNEADRGTLWGAYNAVSSWTDHDRGRDESRMSESLTGQGAAYKARAHATCVELLEETSLLDSIIDRGFKQ